MSLTKTFNGKVITIDDSERQQTEIWTRVMGYYQYRPISEFNIGKKAEHKERVFFSENTSIRKPKEILNIENKDKQLAMAVSISEKPP